MEKLADLHVHTCLSDGTFTPAETVEGAKAGLSCIAITDHDCVDAIAPARKAARGKGIEIIPGVEMTAQEKSREVHILGYYPDIKDARFLNRLKAIRQNRVDRAYKIIEKLRKYDIFLDPKAVFELSGPGSVGRMHIASALEQRGYVSSIKEAFNRYIGDKGPCYVAHYEITTKDAIAELKRVGAVVVFAHPQLMGGEELIPKFMKYGLDGLEAFHSEQSKSVARKFTEIAGENGLLVTGGSDCHGLNKGRMLMGTVMVPYSLVEGLKKMRKEDKKYINAAIELALTAKGRTSPNPCVGAVVAKGGKIIGKGYHRYAGGPHAEVYALKQAGRRAKGATLYVSLEPCRHYGKTPPCVDMIKEYGIRRVVAAMKDPNPLNNGKGLASLRRYGIKAESGIMRKEARELNRPFIKYMEEKTPFVVVKAAQTLDGKIATRTGDSKWVSNEASRRYAHRLRSEADAVIVGANTVIKDDPLLTARIKSGKTKQPLRVILAGRRGIPKDARVLHSRGGEALVIMPDRKTGKVVLKELLRKLAGRGVMSVLIEGGGEVIASAFREKVVDKVYFFIAPKIAGGRDAKSSVEGKGVARMKDSVGIRDIKLHDMDGDLLIEGYVRR